MKRKDTGRGMLLLWTASVYALSFLCYLPMLAQRMGMALPGGAVNLKYLFVCVPAVVSVLFSLRERRLRAYFAGMFSGRPGGREFSAGLAIAAAGLLVSWGYEAGTGVPVFENAYPSVAALLAGCLYLLATGLVEEMAWRGFLLERLPQKGIKGAALAGPHGISRCGPSETGWGSGISRSSVSGPSLWRSFWGLRITGAAAS